MAYSASYKISRDSRNVHARGIPPVLSCFFFLFDLASFLRYLVALRAKRRARKAMQTSDIIWAGSAYQRDIIKFFTCYVTCLYMSHLRGWGLRPRLEHGACKLGLLQRVYSRAIDNRDAYAHALLSIVARAYRAATISP